MLSEEKFYEKAKEFALLNNTNSEYYTLEEYKEKVKPLQTDKDSTVVYLYTTDATKQDAFIQAAHKKSYDVLLMNSPIDNHFIHHLEMKLENTSMKRVDADVPDKLIAKEDAPQHQLSEEDRNKVKAVFEKAINNAHMKVDLESLPAEAMPVTITME